ncbi:PP2C family protein-serine/threonine phosphatase [Leisingera sp. McT4-56]|uniref:PP2C family protein-serine/threonine phosphatase n=1 Tax=Leisingera sp. McT4-56 TaxID=2881255 RepID=UPI001CF826FB|nr:protein phosphatase 2C domain-containing protein [Leisingera sp. McT4-56]MCB4456779.1 protein phosphatase 2C domain-containing protein [Leisingera sp. McT4-56]
MLHSAELEYDAATAISQGRRDRQEDAVAADFLAGAGTGFAVLADGMGGHAAGDVAAKIVVTEVFSELKLRAGEPEQLEPAIGEVLHSAADGANACLGEYASHQPQLRAQGMGATLLAPVLFRDRLYWISVGDSPLYLFRDGALIRLNADHSMAAELEKLVARGRMDPAEAAAHPDRHCVTSVLTGADIPHIDCRSAPVRLQHGDIVLAASDGLLFLAEEEIAEVLAAECCSPSARIGAALMQRLEALDAPEQDNAAFCVIKPFDPQAAPNLPAPPLSAEAPAAGPLPAEAEPLPGSQPAAPARPRTGRRVITFLATATWRDTPGGSRSKTDASA